MSIRSAWLLGGALAFGCSAPKPPSQKSVSDARPSAAAKAPTVQPASKAAVGPVSPYAKRPDERPPGPEVCADCHPDETDGFAATGMGRSLYRPAGAPVIEDFAPDKATVEHPLTGVGYRALVDAEGRWWQEEFIAGGDYSFKVEVKYIVGSGNHTRSYIGELEGELVELPMTWYSRRRIWDMSPGYEIANHYRFARPIKPQCIFCHNDLSPHVEGTMARYRDFAEGITCTRCHGDATAHVAAREAGKGPGPGEADPTILNPRRLDPQAQLRVCQQCHLTGVARVLMPGRTWDHYDPREPLETYTSIYVYEKDGGPDFGISSHGDRLALSACFKGSGGQLSCTRCHDPHKVDDARLKRGACLECHKVEQCGDAHGRTTDDCASCHMYSGGTVDIPHVHFTDHFIRKKPRAEGEQKPAGVALVDAIASAKRAPDPKDDAERLALGHAHVLRFMSNMGHLGEARERLMRASADPTRPDVFVELGHLLKAERNLPAAAAAYGEARARSDNPLFRIDLAEVLEGSGRLEDAEAVLREAIATRPDYRIAIGNLANVLQRQSRFAEAEQMYARAEAIAPHISITANNRGHNSIQMGDLDGAERFFREALRRDGTNPLGHFNLGTLALKRKRNTEARGHFRDALELDPKFVAAHWLLGRMELDGGDLAAARYHLEKMATMNPQNPNAWLDLARVEHKVGDEARRREVLMRGLMMVPGQPDLQKALQKAMGGHPP